MTIEERVHADARLARVGVIVHPRRDSRAPLAALMRWAEGHGVDVVQVDENQQRLPLEFSDPGGPGTGVESSLVIVLGGDGTILRALRLAAPQRVPVLAVNLGRFGFLAEIELEELPAALESIAAGQYRVEERTALTLYPAEGHSSLVETTAYNDVAFARVPGRGPAALAVDVNDENLARYAADALVISTPTGSTAHSFSAGGPIVSPRVKALLVTPVAPHASFDRAVVLHPDESVRLRVLDRSATLLVECDGQTAGELVAGESAVVRVAERPGLLVRLGDASFYTRARRKLQLPDSLALG